MGQKVQPNGLRLGIVKDFNAKWYAEKQDYSKFLIQDLKVREFLEKKHVGNFVLIPPDTDG